MATQINSADKHYVVSSIKEVGTSRKMDRTGIKVTSLSTNRTENSYLQDMINDITSDGIITPLEKRSMKYQYELIVRDYADMTKVAEELDIESSTQYTNLTASYLVLKTKFENILSSMGTSSQVNKTEFSGLVTDFSTKSNTFTLYAEAVKFDISEQSRLQASLSVVVSLSPIIVDYNEYSTITVALYLNGEDVTSSYQPNGTYKWTVSGLAPYTGTLVDSSETVLATANAYGIATLSPSTRNTFMIGHDSVSDNGVSVNCSFSKTIIT